MLEFLPDGRIGRGGARNERWWQLREDAGEKVLEISGEDRPTLRLTQSDPGTWKGNWHHFEQMPVELTRWKRPAVPRVTVYGPFRGLTGHDHHVREFARELDRREVEVRLLDLSSWSPAKLPEHLRESWFEKLPGHPGEGPVLQFCMPHQVIRWPNSPTINYTMFEGDTRTGRLDRAEQEPRSADPARRSRRGRLGLRAACRRTGSGCALWESIPSFATEWQFHPRELPGGQYRTRFLNVSGLWTAKESGRATLRAWKRATSRRDDGSSVPEGGML